MDIEKEIVKINARLDSLTKSMIQMSANQTPITAKVDDSANQVKAITPYTETKTAYIGDTEIVFSDVPEGNVTVFGIDEQVFRVKRIGNTIRVSFKPLEEVTEITISIS